MVTGWREVCCKMEKTDVGIHDPTTPELEKTIVKIVAVNVVVHIWKKPHSGINNHKTNLWTMAESMDSFERWCNRVMLSWYLGPSYTTLPHEKNLHWIIWDMAVPIGQCEHLHSNGLFVCTRFKTNPEVHVFNCVNHNVTHIVLYHKLYWTFSM